VSNALAIAATTATLHTLLVHEIPRRDVGLADLNVTTQPPDRARTGVTTAQLNVFLYQTVVNAAWRNMDMPRPPKSGGTGFPPLALNLFYLITAYGRGDADNDAVSHRVLGSAMSVLHDHPLLGADEIRSVMPGNDLARQIERVRITPQPFSVEEISKLWTAFQTNYRLSAAYEATVVLIDSMRPTRSALPVLTRRALDDGAGVDPNVRSPYPTILAVEHPTDTPQPSFRLGDTLQISGFNLDGTQLAVEFRHPRLDRPFTIAPSNATASALTVVLPNDPSWPAGIYSVAVVVQRPTDLYQRRTNEIPITVAPRIQGHAQGAVVQDAQHNATLTVTVTCHPNVLADQRVLLVFGDQEIAAAPFGNPSNTLTFRVVAVPPGLYYLRLRIDGVDSLLVADYTKKPPEFDPAQRIDLP
jgi:hypothetical protein